MVIYKQISNNYHSNIQPKSLNLNQEHFEFHFALTSHERIPYHRHYQLSLAKLILVHRNQ